MKPKDLIEYELKRKLAEGYISYCDHIIEDIFGYPPSEEQVLRAIAYKEFKDENVFHKLKAAYDSKQDRIYYIKWLTKKWYN